MFAAVLTVSGTGNLEVFVVYFLQHEDLREEY